VISLMPSSPPTCSERVGSRHPAKRVICPPQMGCTIGHTNGLSGGEPADEDVQETGGTGALSARWHRARPCFVV
jgi:hypothetical protein